MQLRDGTTVQDRRLDRLRQFDERSRNFAAAPGTLLLRSRSWSCPEVLDQGREGACVGYALTHALLAAPIDSPIAPENQRPVARRIYRRAKRIDEWPGERYSGTSVLAGCRTLRRAGQVKRFEWAFGLAEVLAVVSTEGPVVLGIDWYESMYEAPGGRVRVKGKVAGGHAILCNALDVDRESVTLHNSWGPSWGKSGEAALSWDDLARLLEHGGEAVLLRR